MSVVATTDGRVITGRILASDEHTLTVQTATDQVHLRRSEVEQTETLPKSLMPEDLLKDLHINKIRDLIAYLMSDGAN